MIHENSVQRYPNGTPLSDMIPTNKDADASSSFISFMSFNVLAPLYVRPFDKRTGGIQPFAAFEWISQEDTPDILDIDGGRGQRLLQCLRTCDADVICLQELQLERMVKKGDFMLPAWIQPLLQANNGKYQYRIPPQVELEVISARNVRVLDADVAVTCAILYKSDKLVQVSPRDVSSLGEKDADVRVDTNTCVTIHLSAIPGKEGDVHSTSIEPFVVSSVHLDAMDEKKRVGQLARCLKKTKSLTSIKGPNGRIIPQNSSIIIAGDMNQEFFAGSCVTAFLHHENATDKDMEEQCVASLRLPKGSSLATKQREEWNQLYQEAKNVVFDHCTSLDRINTEATRAAYDHDQDDVDRTLRKMGRWRLDHTLYTPHSFEPCAMWATLEDDQESCESGLPNRRHGSDHIPIAAVFKCTSAPNLDAENIALIHSINVLAKEQKTALESAERELNLQLAEIEQRFQEKKETNVASGPTPPKKAKLKKGRPPQEVIDFMRKKRSIMKDMKASARKQRHDLVAKLGNLERLTIEQNFGYSASLWVDKGDYTE